MGFDQAQTEKAGERRKDAGPERREGGQKGRLIAAWFSRLPDLHDSRAVVDDLRLVADGLAHQRLGERSDIGNEPLGRIGFVFADEPEAAAFAVLEFDDDAMAEPHMRMIGDRPDDFGAGATRRPIAQIALRQRERVIVFARRRAFDFLLQARKLGFNLFEAFGRDQIAVRTDRAGPADPRADCRRPVLS